MLALTIVFALGSTAGLPDGIRKALETQLPAWAAVGGNPAPSSEGMERIAVERTSGPVWKVFLLERKIRAEVRAEGDRNWLTEATWCGAGADRCDDVWSRTDEQWRSDKATGNHTGYAVYRDSLRLSVPGWTESVPAPATGRKKWDKGLCEAGLCFLASAKDSSLARAAVRSDGSTLWWDGGYVLGGALEKDQLHGWKLVLEKGKPLPAGR
jgi:hypothetical protein